MSIKHHHIPTEDYSLDTSIISPDTSPAKGKILWLLGRFSKRLESIDDYQRLSNSMGRELIIFDYHGSDKVHPDTEDASLTELCHQALTLFDWVVNNASPSTEISVSGASLGAAPAMYLANKRQFQNLLLRVPALFPPDCYDVPLKLLNMKEINVYRHHSEKMRDHPALKQLAKFNGRILILQNEKDEIMPRQIAETIKRALPKADFALVEGAYHSISTTPDLVDDYNSLIGTWLDN